MKNKTGWFVTGTLLLLFSCLVIKPAFSEEKKDRENSSPAAQNEPPVTDSSTGFLQTIYNNIGLASKGLAFETFRKAYAGYKKLYDKGLIKNTVLTIADMSQPSFRKRLYVIDMNLGKLLINTLVAHGKNSGETMASKFSNIPSSLQSSLGFYVTGNTYEGHNGYSLRLFGMEKGFNDQAGDRAIVMHGASYVNEDLARKTGRIGRSWGCPAVSIKEHQQIINTIKNGSCLYLYAPEKQYLANSALSNVNDNTL